MRGLVAAVLLMDGCARATGEERVASPVDLSGDVEALLAFKVAVVGNRRVSQLRTWGADTMGPCDTTFDTHHLGWYGVMCCSEYAELTCRTSSTNVQRVTHLNLRGTEVGGDVATFAPLSELRVLRLYYTQVVGHVASLAILTRLTYLSLEYTSVDGDIASLSGLVQLTKLGLAGTHAYGDPAVLRRSIPGLQRGWSPGEEFSPCSDFITNTGCPPGTKPVAVASFFAGSDECVCCMLESSDYRRFRVPTTGACVEPPIDKTYH
eukprot:COSAG02_NODE_16430_length_1084_cov_0.941117_1_plen_264_part_00